MNDSHKLALAQELLVSAEKDAVAARRLMELGEQKQKRAELLMREVGAFELRGVHAGFEVH